MNKTLKASVGVIALARKKPTIRLYSGLTVIAVLCLIGLVTWLSISQRTAYSSCPFLVPSQELSTGRSFNSFVSRGDCIRLGRVTTPQDQEQGLSGRDFMPYDEGLLFAFERPTMQCMWMKDMRFDLDMIWLDANQTISHIETDLSPQTYPKTYCGNGSASYVIEVNAGVVKAAKLKVGNKLQLEK